MSAAPLPALPPVPPWAGEPGPWTRTRGTLRLRRDDGARVTVEVERCAAGRLRAAYPVGEHDVEIAVTAGESAAREVAAEALRHMVEVIWEADPRCRRVVLAAPVDDPDAARTARDAGFRPAVEVELPGSGTVELLVREPDRVTRVDMDLDRVPT